MRDLDNEHMMPDLFKIGVTALALQNSTFIHRHGEMIERDERNFAKVETLGSYLAGIHAEKNTGEILGGLDIDAREMRDNERLSRYYVFHVMTKDRGMCDVIVDSTGKDAAQVYLQDENGKVFELDEKVKENILKMGRAVGASEAEVRRTMPSNLKEFTEHVMEGKSLVPKHNGEMVDRLNEKRKEENRAPIEKDEDTLAQEDMTKAEEEEKRIMEVCAAAGVSMDKVEEFCKREGITIESILSIKLQDVTPAIEAALGKDAIKVGGKVLAIKTRPLDNGRENKAFVATTELDKTLAGTEKSQEILETVDFDTKDEKKDRTMTEEDFMAGLDPKGNASRARYLGELKGENVNINQKALYIAEAKYANFKLREALEAARNDPSPQTTQLTEKAMRERVAVDERFGLAPMSESTKDSLDNANKILAADPDKEGFEFHGKTVMTEVMHEGDAKFQSDIFNALHREMEEKIQQIEAEMLPEIKAAPNGLEKAQLTTELATKTRNVVSEYRDLFTTVASYYTFDVPKGVADDMKAHEEDAEAIEQSANAKEGWEETKKFVKDTVGLGKDEDDGHDPREAKHDPFSRREFH